MRFHQAIDQAIKEFNLSAKDLAEKTGMSSSQLSQYRHGKREIHTDNLEKLITALPEHVRHYVFFNCLVSELSGSGIAVLLNAISLKIADVEIHKPEFEKISA
jgi:transcriptional regulator with XRE-family HTH domain